MNSIWTKIAMIGGAVILLAALLLCLKWQHDLLDKQSKLDQSMVEMKKLNDNIVRAQSKYVSSDDLNKFAKDNKIDLKPIRDDLDKLHAEIQGISTATIITSGFQGTSLPSTSHSSRSNDPGVVSVPCPSGGSVICPDPFGYLHNAQVLALNEPIAGSPPIPFGETQFRSWQEKPWDLKIYPRTYSSSTVLGQDENGKHYTYHKFSITVKDKTYPVKIDDAKFVEEFPEEKFRFSPRLYLGVDAGTYINPIPSPEVTPNLHVALFSRGTTKTSPTWTFLGVGLGYETQESRLAVVLTPVNYNVGKHLPLVENLFIGPTITFDTMGSFSVIGGMRVGL